jgi:hypothetical protein
LDQIDELAGEQRKLTETRSATSAADLDAIRRRVRAALDDGGPMRVKRPSFKNSPRKSA